MFTGRSSLACAALAALAGLLGSPALANEELETRLSSGTLTIGIHNRSPWGFRNAEGEVIGFHPDLVRAALEPLGLEEVNFVVSEFGALIPGLNANRFDMIASGVAITPERCGQVIFSEPDLSVGDGLIVAGGNPKNIHSFTDVIENQDLVIASGRGTQNTAHAQEAGVPEAQLLLLPETNDIVSAVIAGRADAGLMSVQSVIGFLADPNVAARGLERAEPFEGLVYEDGTPAALHTAVAFRPGDEPLRDAYNQRLTELMESGQHREIMERYGFGESELPPERTAEELCGQ